MTYNIRLTVAAATRLEAIEKAVAKLRTGLRLRGVGDVRFTGGFWIVRLSVEEDA